MSRVTERKRQEKRDCMKYGIVFATPDEAQRAWENQIFLAVIEAKGAAPNDNRKSTVGGSRRRP